MSNRNRKATVQATISASLVQMGVKLSLVRLELSSLAATHFEIDSTKT